MRTTTTTTTGDNERSDLHPTDPRPGRLAPKPTGKTCEYGHHYYTGQSCPFCDFLGRENLRQAYSEEDHE